MPGSRLRIALALAAGLFPLTAAAQEAPRLVPLSEIEARIPAPRLSPATGSDLAARAARLEARAARLRAQGPVDAATRARFAAVAALAGG